MLFNADISLGGKTGKCCHGVLKLLCRVTQCDFAAGFQFNFATLSEGFQRTFVCCGYLLSGIALFLGGNAGSHLVQYAPLFFQDQGTDLFNADHLSLFCPGSHRYNGCFNRLSLFSPIFHRQLDDNLDSRHEKFKIGNINIKRFFCL